MYVLTASFLYASNHELFNIVSKFAPHTYACIKNTAQTVQQVEQVLF